MIHVPDIIIAREYRTSLILGVAPQAEVRVALHQKFSVYRAVRGVTDGTTFTEGRVLENKRPSLRPMAGSTGLVKSRHGQTSRRFENVATMRVVALRAIDFLLRQRVVLGEMKFGLGGPMAFKTGSGIFPGVDYEFTPPSAACDMQAARAVAGFAPCLACGTRVLQTDAHVSTRREDSANVRMTLSTRLVTDKSGSGDLGGSRQCKRSRRTRIDQQQRPGGNRQNAGCDGNTSERHDHWFITAGERRKAEAIAASAGASSLMSQFKQGTWAPVPV